MSIVGLEGEPMATGGVLTLNVADARRRLSELIGRVSFGGATVLITRRGRPMAKLVPPDSPGGPRHLADVAGWLEDHDPFLAALDDIVASRIRHRPRVAVSGRGAASRRPRRRR